MNKRGSVVLIAILVVSIISLGVATIYESQKSNSQEIESVLINNGQVSQEILQNNSEITSKSVVESTSSHHSSTSYKKSISSPSKTESPSLDISGLSIVNNSPEVFNDSNSTGNLDNLNQSRSMVQPRDLVNGYCKSSSKETLEGPGGTYCQRDDYEECFNYQVKSTVYACNKVLWCSSSNYNSGYFDIGTDYCSSDILNEAFLECGFTAVTRDFVGWQQKNCQDYNGVGDWVYYCTADQVRKHKGSSNFGCSNGACIFVSGGWVDDTLVSALGDGDYCAQRVQYGCSLCTSSQYGCYCDSDCASGLQCKGGTCFLHLSSGGCCSSSARWDSTLKTCCECSSGDGPCCDGCHFKSSNTVCNSHISGTDQYKCSDNCLGSAVYGSYQNQYCSGTSSSCSGAKYLNDYNYQFCSDSEFCSGSTSWGKTIPTCKTAQCTDGICCDTTCGSYNFKSTNTQCWTGTEYGCFWGNDLGDDVSQRPLFQYCSGSSQLCDGRSTNGGWTVFDDCSNTQWCGGTQGQSQFFCSSIACSQKSDCGDDYWYGVKCYDNDVYGNFVTYGCKYPGTKKAECTNLDLYQKKEECGDSGYTGDNYCYGGNVYKDYVTRLCSNAKCSSSTSRNLQKDCGGLGCTNGKCNGDLCTDECSNGDKKCSGNYAQTCGNYDSDSCLEWPSSTSGSGNQYCTYGCINGQCNSAPLPDLTVTNLIVQSTSGKNVTLAFTVKNIGNATANSVYWMVDSNSSDPDPKRITPISLAPGNWTRAYMVLTYGNSGTYRPKAIVDFNNIVSEFNESNNQQSISVIV